MLHDDYDDLREWIDKVEAMGELRRLDGANWDLEIGGLTELAAHTKNGPALLFDKITGYPAGYRVISNMSATNNRIGLMLRIPAEANRLQFLKLFRQKLKDVNPIPPRVVETGPIMENVFEGSNIDLWKFPAPKWNQLDGGRALGTGDVALTKDIDEGWVNLGVARGIIQDTAAIGFVLAPDRHADMHMRKYHVADKPCPAALVCGCDPLLHLMASMSFPWGTSEYDIAGGLRGRPVDVIMGDVTGLPIPASAEIVVEGELVQGDLLPEGPFGEWSGYYANGRRDRTVLRVKRLMHRNGPIITGAPPQRPPSANAYMSGLRRSAQIWDELEAAGVPEIKGVWSHEASGGPLFTVVSIKQRYPGHAKQAALVASQCSEGLRNGKFVTVVDEDIDPSDLEEVIWAISTRVNPERSIEVIRRSYATISDPSIEPDAMSGPEQRRRYVGSRAILDATRPYEWMDKYAPVVGFSADIKKDLQAKWGHILA